MRGQTLANLRAQLKAEIGYSQDSSATASDTSLNLLLANKQKWLASEWDWPFLQHRWDVSLTANTRWYSIPTTTSATGDVAAIAATINFERPIKVESYWGVHWHDVDYGISSEQYNTLNSEQSQGVDPIQRWRFATDTQDVSNSDKIEVWPVPQTAQTLRFTGQRNLQALTSDAHYADLDDMLLVYFVAAELTARLDLKDSQMKMSLAQQRLRRLLGNYPTPERRLILGGSSYDHDVRRKVVPIITIA